MHPSVGPFPPPSPPSPELRRDGGCIFTQRLPQFIDGLLGWFTNNIRNSFNTRFFPYIFQQHRHYLYALKFLICICVLWCRPPCHWGFIRSCGVVMLRLHCRRGSVWSVPYPLVPVSVSYRIYPFLFGAVRALLS